MWRRKVRGHDSKHHSMCQTWRMHWDGQVWLPTEQLTGTDDVTSYRKANSELVTSILIYTQPRAAKLSGRHRSIMKQNKLHQRYVRSQWASCTFRCAVQISSKSILYNTELTTHATIISYKLKCVSFMNAFPLLKLWPQTHNSTLHI